jgi:hypothetical protein
MQEAKRIAIGNYRQVLEDGPDKCDSESDNENSDHGEKWLDSEMYTPDVMNEDGKPDMTRARSSTEQANALRARSGGPSVQEPAQRQHTPAHSDEDDADFESDWFQTRTKASAKKKTGRAGCLVTVSGKG